VTALIGVIGVVVGAVVTQLFNPWLDKNRLKAQATERQLDRAHERTLREGDRDHERKLRARELVEAHRGRLYGDRRAAYTEFYRSYLEYRRAQEDASLWWGHIHERARDRTLPGDPDTAQENWDEALNRYTYGQQETEQALMLVELVASPRVRDAAAELRRLAGQAGARSLMSAASGMSQEDSFDLYDKHQETEKAVREGEQRLREAIQAELELGREGLPRSATC
jgi:hypothetical protein